jgi:hypothetical protein
MAQIISNHFKRTTVNSGVSFKTASSELSSIKLLSPRGGFDLSIEKDAIFNSKGSYGYSLNASTGGFHVNVNNNINLNTINDINILSEKGNLNVDVNDNISLHTRNDIILTTTTGNAIISACNDINLNSGGNIDIEATNGKFELDAMKEIKINTTDTVKGIMIGTTTQGVPIMIGSETSIVTIARDGLIFNDILYNNSVIPQIGDGVSNSLFVEWINHGKISNMNHLQLFISLAGLYDSGGVIGNMNGEEAYFGCFIEDFFTDVFSFKIECIETPSGGNSNISFQSHSSNRIRQGNILNVSSDMVELSSNQWMIDSSRYAINLPRKGSYLYLSSNRMSQGQDNSNRFYTAGKFIITFWSK